MKKLMIAAAIVCAAAFAQAASVSWSTEYLNGSNGVDIDENPGYTYSISVLIAGSDAPATYDYGMYSGEVDDLALSTQYQASIVVTEYKNGVANATLTGSGMFTTTGSDSFPKTLNFSTGGGFDSVTSIGTGDGKWQAVPEPTSGLLLLLGVAGLALRRRRA